MDPEDGPEDDGPVFAWLPPEDRLWRHPSEVGSHGARGGPRPRTPGLLRVTSSARSWGVTVCAGAIGALLAVGVGMTTGTFGHHTVVDAVDIPTPDTVALASSAPASEQLGDWAAIDDSMAPSVVGVDVAEPTGTEASSGVLWAASRRRSYIITAADVTSGASRISVVLDGDIKERAHLVGSDPSSEIALLWISGDHRNLIPVIGSVSSIQVADPVLDVAARTPAATPVDTATVTGLDQQLDADGSETLYGMVALSGVTISAAADGGALVDSAGEVIGVDTDLTSVDPADQGVAYAVPIDMAGHVAAELLEGHQPSDPWVGIDDATDLSTTQAQALGVKGGAEVGQVAPGSPAAADGLRTDDVVTGFDGQAVTSSGTLVRLLSECHPGERTMITYLDGGQRHRAAITVTSEPAPTS